MNRYLIKLFPDSLKVRQTVDFRDVRSIIEKEVVAFNTFSKTAKNRKYIDSLDIQKNIIQIEFSSDAQLAQPAKSLRFFLVALTKHPFFEEIIKGQKGRFMRSEFKPLRAEHLIEKTSIYKVDATANVSLTNEKVMTDEDILKKIVSLFFSNSPTDREKIESIKKIIEK